MPIRREVPAMLAVAATMLASPATADDALAPARQEALRHLLRHDCGACHGLTLRGGLGPPLRPEALQGRSVEGLTEVILNGVAGTPMPPWGRLLTRQEAAWLARRLKKEEDTVD